MSLPLLISETFTSLQGEGKLTGVPSFFIRLSGCNLRCRWCDTPYASWNPEGERQSIDDLVAAARASGVRHAVLTGGEPMIFPQLTELSTRLAAEADMHITIETAGTAIPEGEFTAHLISISPKLASSTPTGDPRDPTGAWAVRHDDRRLNLPVLQHLLNTHDPREGRGRDRQLKFVVGHPDTTLNADLAEIEFLVSRLTGWLPEDILLMPEGINSPDQAHKAAVAAACLVRAWRYCTRLHIELYGHTRGT